jgi:hypothetical protein
MSDKLELLGENSGAELRLGAAVLFALSLPLNNVR